MQLKQICTSRKLTHKQRRHGGGQVACEVAQSVAHRILEGFRVIIQATNDLTQGTVCNSRGEEG